MITHSDDGPDFDPDDPLTVILRPASGYLGPPAGRYEAIRRGAARRRLLRTAAGAGVACAVAACIVLPLRLATPAKPASPAVPLAPPPASSPSVPPDPAASTAPVTPRPSMRNASPDPAATRGGAVSPPVPSAPPGSVSAEPSTAPTSSPTSAPTPASTSASIVPSATRNDADVTSASSIRS